MLLEVLPDAERAAGAGEHHAPDGGVLAERKHRVAESLLGGDVEAVHRLRTVERHGRHTLGDVDEDRSVGDR